RSSPGWWAARPMSSAVRRASMSSCSWPRSSPHRSRTRRSTSSKSNRDLTDSCLRLARAGSRRVLNVITNRLLRRSIMFRRPFVSAATLAIALLLTAAAAWLWAHAGHHALPTAGVTVDTAKGLVTLGKETRTALDVRVEEVLLQALDDRLTAPATVVA